MSVLDREGKNTPKNHGEDFLELTAMTPSPLKMLGCPAPSETPSPPSKATQLPPDSL